MPVINFHMFNLSTVTVQTFQISLDSLSKKTEEKQACCHWENAYEDSEQGLLSGVRWGWTYTKHSTRAQEQQNQQDYIVKV